MRRLLSVLGLVGVMLASFRGSCNDPSDAVLLNCYLPGEDPPMGYDPLSSAEVLIDFGEVYVESVNEAGFVVRNPDGYVADHSFRWSEGQYGSTVRLSGFLVSECSGGEDAISVGPLPTDLYSLESSELSLQFVPSEPGEWSCVLEPEWTVVSVETSVDMNPWDVCRIEVLASVVADAPEPVCDVQPGADFQFGEVEVGEASELTLTIRNETPDLLTTNQFKFLLDDPSPDCRLFTIDPADTAGVIGPGESKDIVVRFAPDADGTFECTRSLASLTEPYDPADPYITNACPTEVTWRGAGVLGAPVWSSCAPGGSNDWYGVSGVSSSLIYVAGDGGTVIASGGGCNWPASGTVFSEVDLKDIWVSTDGADTVAWAVGNIPPPPGMYGETGAILRMDGAIWQKADEGGFVTYGAVWGSALDDVYFVGTGVSTDFPNAKHWDGSAFDTLSIDWGMSELTGVSGNAADDIWAVLRQQSYSVYHYDGSQWTNETQQWMNKPLHDVWTVAGSGFYHTYAVGEDGAIYHFDGTHWTDESIAGETRNFYGVWVSPTGRVFVVGEGQVIYRFDGNAWSAQSPPPGLPAGDLRDVWGAADDDVYAVGSGGVILRYAPIGG